MGPFCMKFPNIPILRRNKCAKKAQQPADGDTLDEKAYIRILADPEPPEIQFVHVNSKRIRPLTSTEYLKHMEKNHRDKYICRQVRPIVVGTTEAKRQLLADEMISELKPTLRKGIPWDEFTKLVTAGAKGHVFVAVDREDWDGNLTPDYMAVH